VRLTPAKVEYVGGTAIAFAVLQDQMLTEAEEFHERNELEEQERANVERYVR
jgi:hypothetical protein